MAERRVLNTHNTVIDSESPWKVTLRDLGLVGRLQDVCL